MGMTAKHYTMVAGAIAKSVYDCGGLASSYRAISLLTAELAEEFAHENPRFSRDKFEAAISSALTTLREEQSHSDAATHVLVHPKYGTSYGPTTGWTNSKGTPMVGGYWNDNGFITYANLPLSEVTSRVLP